MNIRYFTTIILVAFLQGAFAQVSFFNQKPEKPLLSKADSVLSESLPTLQLPVELKTRDLPPIHDNSESPYLRPIFNQNSSCCGQASGIGYNFTYEINRVRNLPSSDTNNQYPAHFTWNFQNSGNGYFGVSYLHSFEIVKMAGNPNVYDYGGMDNTEGVEWMTGYEKYYNAMHNRIRNVSQIKVNTLSGLNTLKHWLNNHLEGSENGGLASFYASSPYGYISLPEDSPEAGKFVMTAFPGSSATHAMTIVGYHDSIRFDYNEDGQYTNHIDINKDDIVDMKDWEIGGLKFVNSYGENWADSGFCFMMYKTLADNIGEGGIWNHTAHVLDVKGNYEPELTLKFTIKHDSRGKLKISAGVASDTSALIPEHVINFPIFNYQGGNNYMQGRRQEELNKYLETGLDITPLLAYVNSGEQAKFFLQVTETDPLNEGTGRIINLKLVDYNNGTMEIPYGLSDVALVEDGTTRLGISHSPVFDKVEIITEELPVHEGGNNYQVQLEAQNGNTPYQWDLLTPWHEQRYDLPIPEIDDEKLVPEMPNEHFAAKKLEFEFPFFGEKYDTVYMHENGFMMFVPDLYPYPYFNDPFVLFRKMKNISAFHFSPVHYYNDPLKAEPEMWYEGNAYFAAFRWTGALLYFNQLIGDGEFALVLYPDGNIDFFYNGIEVDEEVVWYAGVSAGDEKDYTLLNGSNSIVIPEVSSFRLLPEPLPENTEITDDGLLTVNTESTERIQNLRICVTDDHAIKDEKIFQLSDGLIFNYEVNAGEDGLLQNNELFTINLEVKNIYNEAFQNVMANFISDDPYLELIETNVALGDIAAGESKLVEDAFTLKISESCPNHYTFVPEIELVSDEAEWVGEINFEAFSPSIRISSFIVQDDNNNRLDPGETIDISIRISNTGLLAVENVEVSLETDHPLISINDPLINYGTMQAGEGKSMLFPVSADENIPVGEVVSFEVHLTFADGYEQSKSYQITIGQYTAVVFRKGSNPASAEAIMAAMQELGVDVVYTSSLPEEFEMFRSVFVCLGGFLESNALSQDEASRLVTYLNEGGNLYMEGAMTWTFDPQTSLHPRFNANPEQASFINFNQITGVDGTFTQDMDFTFSGANNILPCLMYPSEPAYPIFNADGDPEKCIAAANPAWNYKTIGSINEFGTLGDESNSNERRDLLYGILDFFGLEEYVVAVPEVGEEPQFNLEISAFPNPFSKEATIMLNLDEASNIKIDLYDLSGRHIRNLTSEILSAGSHSITWWGYDSFGRQVPPGIYIYQLQAGSFTHTGKLIRMK